ncbi:MAG: UDP-N-acetylmuramoyl-L-alanine--D-glutamate ligase [Gammaproteobacteria bacterium]|nr:UDP-N-acetylmuramoyl-L-alanine--D-glutamate ligase [Gammaproteobacteria bacterium]
MNIVSDRLRLVVGLGETGKSVASYLHEEGMAFMLADTRENPPHLAAIKRRMPEVRIYLGDLPKSVMQMVDEVILSPGLPLSHPIAQLARELDKPIISDIELWRRSVTRPVIAVSGSNGKSTVASLLSLMGEAQGLRVASGGNLGCPVLDLDKQADLYIIEISSFQLDITTNLAADVACLLNITPDHMERYNSFGDYYHSKHKIFNGCGAVVYNRGDKLTRPLELPAASTCFSGGQPDLNEFGIIERQDGIYLAHSHKTLINVNELKIIGQHNYQNILAALSVAKLQDWDLAKCLAAVKDFKGLEHRCQWVAAKNDVVYINDSKATNPEAACASLLSVAAMCRGNIHMILGGSCKNADFSALTAAISKVGDKKQVMSYLIGEEAENLNGVLTNTAHNEMCASLPDAMNKIVAAVKPSDMVLLSPACASFDAYDNFAARGEHFMELVGAIS